MYSGLVEWPAISIHVEFRRPGKSGREGAVRVELVLCNGNAEANKNAFQ